MTSDGISSISDAAWLILDNALLGGPSGLDEGTVTWSDSTAAELEQIIIGIQNETDFGLRFVTAMASSSREVSLLAVELAALAIFPYKHLDPELAVLFRRNVDAVAGPALVVPPTLKRGIAELGFRPAGPDDSLPARLLYLTEYVKISGTCPAFDELVRNGYHEYLGHDDLHNGCVGALIIESPWACAEFSGVVDYDNGVMQFDLDHMLWPEFLAPPRIRLAADELRVEHADLLQGDSGNSLIGMQKDLYLLKQLMGSWDELVSK